MRPWERAHARQLVARPPLPRDDRPTRRRSIRLSHVLRYATTPSSAATASCPGTTLEELVAGFEEARRAGGDFCLATHYWEVTQTLKDVMLRFLDHAARRADVRFVAAEELFA